MGKVLLLVFPTFSEFEIGVATAVLRGTHAIVCLGLDRSPVTGEGGLACVPHLSADEVAAADYAGLIVPGGLDMAPVAGALFTLVGALHTTGKPVAAICGGPLVLARAGVLSGRRYTASFTPEQREFLGFPAEGYVNADLVRDGNLLTAKGSAFYRNRPEQ